MSTLLKVRLSGYITTVDGEFDVTREVNTDTIKSYVDDYCDDYGLEYCIEQYFRDSEGVPEECQYEYDDEEDGDFEYVMDVEILDEVA